MLFERLPVNCRVGIFGILAALGSLTVAGQPGGFSAADKAAFLHDSFDPFYRSVEGAVPEKAQITLRFRTGHFAVDGVVVRAYVFDTGTGTTTGPVDTPMTFDQNITANNVEYDAWKVSLMMPSTPAIYYYKFKINKGSTAGFYSDDYVDDHDNVNKDGTGAASDSEPFDSFQITVYDPNFKTPAWMATANVYSIFPDRFRNGDGTNDYCVSNSAAGCPSLYGAPPSSNIAVTTWNTLLCDPRDQNQPCYNNFGSIFYGGDLKGIQDELDYLQAIGFDTLYLTPIFEASSNHRYDTDDYLTVDPALGGNAAFSSLVGEMHRRGMHLILDGVFNHASSDSAYFNRFGRFPDVGACQSLSSPYRSWFHFNDNNVPCTAADYPGWDGFDSLPSFDHTNSEVQNFFYSGSKSVMATWYNAGADGWRFDVAPDPNFPHAWWVATRKFAKQYKRDGPLIGEIWPNASQWLAGDQLDSTMNYRFRRNVLGFARGQYNWIDENNHGNDAILPLTPSQFDVANRAVRDDYPPQATVAMLNLIDSHDTNRALYILTELGDTGLTQAKQRLELAALFQFTYIGAPMVFYGDEVAINAPSRANGNNGPIGDPYARAPYPWTDQPGDPSIYGPPDRSVQAFYTKLTHLRKQHACLATGAFRTLLTGDTQQSATAANTYAYARVGNHDTAIVALNNGASVNTASIAVSNYFRDGATLQDALSGRTYSVAGGNVSIALNPISGAVLLPAKAHESQRSFPARRIVDRLNARRTMLQKIKAVTIAGTMLLAAGLIACAQEKPASPPGKAEVTLKGKQITITYSRPFMRGRKIFGGLVPYDHWWRTGANEATTLTTGTNLDIGGANVPAGTYTLYTLPSEGTWKLIINKQTGQWGTEYNQDQDLARVDMQKSHLEQPVEEFTISFNKKGSDSADLVLEWENTKVWVPVKAQ